MIDKDELYRKIKDIFPDIGECGIDLNVAFDETSLRSDPFNKTNPFLKSKRVTCNPSTNYDLLTEPLDC